MRQGKGKPNILRFLEGICEMEILKGKITLRKMICDSRAQAFAVF